MADIQQKYSQVGVHVMFTLESVVEDRLLQYADDLQGVLDGLVTDLGLTVVGKIFHQFKPLGATGLYLLSESHLSAHTFYETRKIHIDIFCCDATFDPQKAIRAFKKRFQAIPTNIHVLNR